MLVRVIIHSIRMYQCFISPLLLPQCRFHPTCSQYSIESFQKYGMKRGTWLTVKRLAKCHQFHPGGYDPV